MKNQTGWLRPLTRAVEESETPMAMTRHNVIVYGNAAFNRLCGDVINRTADELFDEDGAEFFRLLTGADEKESDKVALTIAVGESAGSQVLVQMWPVDDTIGLLSLSRRFSLRRLADMDALTSLPNRRKANLLLEIEWTRLNRFTGFCLAICDIDHFKSINDTYGHLVGDQVLCHVAEMLQKGLRVSDWAARWGGEEFLIFVQGSDMTTAMLPIERVRNLLRENPFLRGSSPLPVTMSFGFVSSENCDSIEQIIHRADILMYEAKRSGRDRVVWEKAKNKIWHTGDIAAAVRQREIAPAYRALRAHDGGRALAVSIAHGLRGEDEEEVARMMSAADRLSLRDDIDLALLESAAASLPAKSDIPFFFPVFSSLVKRQKEALFDLFKQFPYLCAGVSSQAMPARADLDALAAAGASPALLDFTPDDAPMGLLSGDIFRHLIYQSPDDEAANVLAMMPAHITCYAAGGGDAARAAGFAGYVSDKYGGDLDAVLAAD